MPNRRAAPGAPPANVPAARRYNPPMPDTVLASIGDLTLHHGGVLRDTPLAYIARGALAHGATPAAHARLYLQSSIRRRSAAAEGCGPGVGPGRPIDTDPSSSLLNMPAEPARPAPLTPPPAATAPTSAPHLADIVTAQRRLLDHSAFASSPVVGVVRRLPGSPGAREFPDFVRASSRHHRAAHGRRDRRRRAARRLAADPAWNGGRRRRRDDDTMTGCADTPAPLRRGRRPRRPARRPRRARRDPARPRAPLGRRLRPALADRARRRRQRVRRHAPLRPPACPRPLRPLHQRRPVPADARRAGRGRSARRRRRRHLRATRQPLRPPRPRHRRRQVGPALAIPVGLT